jgi:hypothetical protein
MAPNTKCGRALRLSKRNGRFEKWLAADYQCDGSERRVCAGSIGGSGCGRLEEFVGERSPSELAKGHEKAEKGEAYEQVPGPGFPAGLVGSRL